VRNCAAAAATVGSAAVAGVVCVFVMAFASDSVGKPVGPMGATLLSTLYSASKRSLG